jgi:hypothetical protein
MRNTAWLDSVGSDDIAAVTTTDINDHTAVIQHIGSTPM